MGKYLYHIATLFVFIYNLPLGLNGNSFQSYSIKQGLNHTHVLSVFQDNKGYLWIGTYGGLHRFNGYAFEYFTTGVSNPKALSNNSVNAIIQDKNGFVWFGTEEGLNRYNSETGEFKKYLHTEGQMNYGTIRSLLEDEQGKIYIGTYGGGLNIFNPETDQFEYLTSEDLGYSDNSFDKINTLFDRGNNELWIGTEGGGVFILNKKTKNVLKHYQSLRRDTSSRSIIAKIFQDSENNIWVGTWEQGLFKYDSINESFIDLRLKHPYLREGGFSTVKDIVEDQHGNLWLAHFGGGITKFNPVLETFENFAYNKNDKQSMSNNMAWDLLVDTKGTLWVGTFGGGLNKMHSGQYNIPLIKIPPEIINLDENAGISDVLCDENDMIWLGTYSSGLFRYSLNTQEFQFVDIFRNEAIKSIMSLHLDFEKNIWIGTDNGLYHLNTINNNLKRYKSNFNKVNSLTDKSIYCISQDSDSNLWLGTWNNGMQFLSKSEYRKQETREANFLTYRHVMGDSTSLANDIVYSIYEDKSKQIWVGSSEYLQKFNVKTKSFQNVLKTIVSNIYEDESGIIWVSSLGDGLFSLTPKGDIIDHYQISNQLNSKKFYDKRYAVLLGMIADNENNIWLANNLCISSFNKKTKRFSNYSLEDDLSQNAISLNAFTKTKNGNIIVGGIDGINIINPAVENLTASPPLVVFTDFKIFNNSIVNGNTPDSLVRINKPAAEVKELNLSYKDKLIQIDFAAIELTEPNRINYSYMLEGFDKDWINCYPGYRFAMYSNLSPGEYNFKVKASNSKGQWNTTYSSVKINIKPPFWKTLWFKVIFVICILGLITTIIQLRTRMLYKQKQELKKLVDEQTSEIIRQYKELAKSNQELNTQKEELIEKTNEVKLANERKLRFFTSMSHEFRTPLTLILGPLENLMERLSTNDTHAFNLSLIQKNSLRLLRLINEILDLRKYDTQNMKVVCIKGDLIAFTSNVVDAFKGAANKNEIEISFESNHSSLITWFDDGKLEKVYYNLISNALKFTEPKGCIKVAIHINDFINIKVEDTGIGIKQEKLPHIFDRFYQAELNKYSDYKGTGIGLSLTKEIIENLNGEIEVISEPGKGTGFFIKLPFLSPETSSENSTVVFSDEISTDDFSYLIKLLKEPTITNADIEANSEHVNSPDKTILLIEDDIDLSAFIKSCLIGTYRVITAGNGKEGLKLAKSEQPNLVISDVMMPIMDGIEFCSQLKDDFATSHIPVILLSAKTTMELQLEGFETGADAFIPKPFNKTYLLTRVKSIIKTRQKLSENFQKQISVEPKDITATSLDEEFLLKAKNLVEQNLDNSEFGVNELVNELAISRTLLHMKLKKLTNCSTSEFIRLMRLKRACQLLEKKTHRISDICYMVGFNDPHSFSKIFKKHFGQTPTQYAESHS